MSSTPCLTVVRRVTETLEIRYPIFVAWRWIGVHWRSANSDTQQPASISDFWVYHMGRILADQDSEKLGMQLREQRKIYSRNT